MQKLTDVGGVPRRPVLLNFVKRAGCKPVPLYYEDVSVAKSPFEFEGSRVQFRSEEP